MAIVKYIAYHIYKSSFLWSIAIFVCNQSAALANEWQKYNRNLKKLRQHYVLLRKQNIDQTIITLLQNRALPANINITAVTTRGGFNLANQPLSRDYYFSIDGVELCRFQLRAHEVIGQDPVVIGSLPENYDFSNLSSSDWLNDEPAITLIKDELLYRAMDITDFTLTDKKPCIHIEHDQAFAVWQLWFNVEDVPYYALADAENIFILRSNYFDVSGSSKVYEKNKTNGTLKSFTLNDLTGDGTLTSTYFKTDAATSTRASNSSHSFIYSAGTSEFDETSIFTHANETLTWFSGLGFKWNEKNVMTLKVHAEIKGDKNNALYTPPQSSTGASIMVGDGDGQILANLPTDADVVSHEFAHHVIYKSVTEVEGESLVLHEGLADFFTFARTGDTCLGESICPVDSPLKCAVKGTCLRTADNSLAYGAADLPTEAHFRSQFISGMLWDLRKNGKIDADKLTAIVFEAVQLLAYNSGYHDLVLALMIADKNKNNGVHLCYIQEAAIARGLKDKISDIDCAKELPTLSKTATGETASNSGETTVRTTTTKKKGLCGVLGKHQIVKPSLWNILLLLLLPLIIVYKIRFFEK